MVTIFIANFSAYALAEESSSLETETPEIERRNKDLLVEGIDEVKAEAFNPLAEEAVGSPNVEDLTGFGLLPGMGDWPEQPERGGDLLLPNSTKSVEDEADSLVQQQVQKPTKKTILTFVKNPVTWQYYEADLLGIKIIRDKRTKLQKSEDYIVRIPDKDQVGVELYGLPYMPKQEELKETLKKYLSKPLSYGGLEEIVEIIQSHYTENGHPLIHVYVPVQQVAQSVEIAVLEGAITQVDIETKKEEKAKGFNALWGSWYNDSYDMKSLAKKVDIRSKVLPLMQPKDAVAILDEAAVNPWSRLNRKQAHPFLKTSGILSPAKEGDDFLLAESLLTIRHEQKRPLKFFLGYDNTLTDAIGEDRLYFGSIWYDAFNLGLDHQFSTQFFLSPDPDSFNGFASSYLIPWKTPFFFGDSYGAKHFTEIYASYVSTNVDVSAAGIDTNFGGDSIILGAIHYMSLPDIVEGGELEPRSTGSKANAKVSKFYSKAKKQRQAFGVSHELGLGLEVKTSNSSLEFGGSTVSDDDTIISHLLTVYNIRQTDKSGESNFTWRNYFGLGGSSEEDLDRLRVGAEPQYYYTSFSLDREQDLIHGAYLKASLRGQYSTANLLSSEQLGLGGTKSIRGYAERAYRADIGFSASLEIVSPPLHPLRQWTGGANWSDELRFLAFIDYGYGEAVNEEVATDISQTLYSVGAGLRYQVNNNVTFRFDYGVPLQDLDSPEFDEDLSDSRYHLGVVWTF